MTAATVPEMGTSEPDLGTQLGMVPDLPTDYLAIPFDWQRGGQEKWEILAQMAADRPHWFSGPTTDPERRQIVAYLLTHPEHLVWEVWRGGAFVGILMLQRIAPKADALLHFVFVDRSLSGKAKLIQRFCGYCFEDLGLQRLSLEVPEYLQTLASFARRKLDFRFEGEGLEPHPVERIMLTPTRVKVVNPHQWLAERGARREQAHWCDGKWYDVLCLRLLAREYRELHPEV